MEPTSRGSTWGAEAAARPRNGLVACTQPGDSHKNEAWYESLFTHNLPLWLSGLTEFTVNVPAAGNPLLMWQHLQSSLMLAFQQKSE